MSQLSIFNTHAPGSDGNAPTAEGVAVSSTTVYYSEIITGRDGVGIDIQLFWTGDPTGTVTAWTSDKTNPSVADDADWVQESAAFTAVNPAGSASKGRELLAGSGLRKRLKYTNASGSGVLKGYANVVQSR